LRLLASQLDKDTMVRRLHDTTQGLLAVPDLRENAVQNWYILYAEPLPA
jgi:hypothetical protein